MLESQFVFDRALSSPAITENGITRQLGVNEDGGDGVVTLGVARIGDCFPAACYQCLRV